MTTTYTDKVQLASQFIIDKISSTPTVAVILGSGLSGFEQHLEQSIEINTADIPFYPVSTAPSHEGKLIIGHLHGKVVLCISGRIHYYEGYDMKDVTFPIRILGNIGVKEVIVTNASGGTNETFDAGDFVFIRDHINLFPENPLRGKNILSWGPRFPDMSEAYCSKGRSVAQEVCKQLDIPFKTGVYVGFPGPNLETPAEYEFIHRIGGDLVGMSTVPEVLVARHMGIRVIGISLVTNACYPPDRIKKTTIEDVLQLARNKNQSFIQLLLGLIKSL